MYAQSDCTVKWFSPSECGSLRLLLIVYNGWFVEVINKTGTGLHYQAYDIPQWLKPD